MRMVMEMMNFVRAVRTGDWALHLEALQAFTKYYFAHDMLTYARMIPVYLAEMGKLKETGAHCSKAPETFRAREAIFRSSQCKNGEVYTPETSCMK